MTAPLQYRVCPICGARLGPIEHMEATLRGKQCPSCNVAELMWFWYMSVSDFVTTTN